MSIKWILQVCVLYTLSVLDSNGLHLKHSQREHAFKNNVPDILHPLESVRWDGPPFLNRTGYGPGLWLQGFLDTPLDHDDITCTQHLYSKQQEQSTTTTFTVTDRNPDRNGASTHYKKAIAPQCPLVSLPILVRLADTQPAPLGPMLIHCGGPSSGKECIYQFINGTVKFYGAPRMDPKLLVGYDIIGIDQRGVQDAQPSVSSSVCFPSNLSDTTQILAALANRTAIQSLLYNDPKYQYANGKNFLDYSSTRDFAMDLNHLRRSIGARTLSVMGFSYGTLVGATYATMYPHNTGRVVLLGPVLSTVDASAFSEGTAQAYEGVLTHVFKLCDKQKGCPAGPASQEMFVKVLQGIKQGVYKAGSGKILMETVFYNYVKQNLMISVTYHHLLSIISGIYRHDQEAIDEVVGFKPVDDQGLWCDHGEVGASSNILGNDYTSRLGTPEMLGEIQRREPLYPLGGQFEAFWYQLVLSGSLSMPRPVRLGNPDISVLVVGNLYDSATSYQWSASLSRAFPSGQLITFQGDGHCMAEATVGYARGEASRCQAVVNEFLLEGSIDPSITLCPVRIEPNTTAEYVPWTWQDVDEHSLQ